MCQNNLGVVKRLDLENISQEMTDFIKSLDKDVKGDLIDVKVDEVKRIAKKLEKIVS